MKQIQKLHEIIRIYKEINLIDYRKEGVLTYHTPLTPHLKAGHVLVKTVLLFIVVYWLVWFEMSIITKSDDSN